MDFIEYREACLRTCADSPQEGREAYLVIHGAVGLVTELRELLDSFSLVSEERGDVWWYLALASEGLGHDVSISASPLLTSPQAGREVVGKAMRQAVYFLEFAKKVYFGSHNIEAHRGDMIAILDSVASKLIQVDPNPDPGATWEANIAKLMSRYPEGFDPELSQNRER